ncbi:C4-dicarboxylate ABC transporter substrate-binding protein [Rhodovibrio sodomensis]|uniref:C4-dicarboxylate ABC transporter substrate-binding protein n=1 Tax=Rhodovibrio sodomensis TaxID=1088 RepID=A0ABS1DKP1_9PROT|nr:TAXI family TRAP transporter solute-binding subunit [Rhodovibrio sodomensis]MBK1670784.1 C4-dicarboxylate ABC transporter substrate-binding protein [Rhodovibrio sodomensis]
MPFDTIRRRLIQGAAAAAVVGVAAAGFAVPDARAQDQNYILSTASTGGTYYPVGVALSTLIKVKLQPSDGINMSAINSAGSGENVRLIREQEAQFAILQGLFGYYAWNGLGPVESAGKQTHLRAITMLWPNVEHFVVASEHAKTGTIQDVLEMQGMSMAMGRRNSGTIGSNRTLLANLGVDMDEAYDLVYVGYGPSGEALQNGQVAGISTPAGDPVGAITQTFATMGDGATLLAFTDAQAEQADGGMGLWTRYVIPGGTYPGVESDVRTIAQPNFLATHRDLPEEDVYKITKTIYENLAFLQNIHPATDAMALENAIAGLPAPLHPGALRYYEEQGIDVPDRLKP